MLKSIFTILKQLVVILLLIGGSSKLYADDVWNLAESYFRSERYDEAITEYKRFIFFNAQDSCLDYAFHRLGLCYKTQEKWEKAVEAERMSIQTAQDDSLKDERKVELGILCIARGNYSMAQLELLRVAYFSQFTPVKQKARFFLGVCYLYLFDWAKAKEVLGDFYSHCHQPSCGAEQKLVDSLLLKANALNYKSERTAKILSTFLPGAGQLYIGNWGRSFNALAINSVTAFLLYDSIQGKSYLNFLSSTFFFLRYYLGNRYRAVLDVRSHNQSLNIKQTNKILKTIGAN